MTRCSHCNSIIVIGGVSDGGKRYCNDNCRQNAFVLGSAAAIPDDIVSKHVLELHGGPCPKCQGSGPVDVHHSHFVWSALLLTQWSSNQQISCRRCALKSQVGKTLGTLVVGWWGFPWGLVMTPVQIVRNIVAICRPPDSSTPSAELRQAVRVSLARMYQQHVQSAPPPLPG